MGLPEDLLEQAEFLISRDPNRPKQASLRRAISTCYYSLFHLLVREAAGAFVARGQLQDIWCRAFEHGDMKRAAQLFSQGNLPVKLRSFGLVPDELRYVATVFVALQDARHQADYDPAKRFYRGEAKALVQQTRTAFANWDAVRALPVAKVFFSALLLIRKIEK